MCYAGCITGIGIPVGELGRRNCCDRWMYKERTLAGAVVKILRGGIDGIKGDG